MNITLPTTGDENVFVYSEYNTRCTEDCCYATVHAEEFVDCGDWDFRHEEISDSPGQMVFDFML